MFTNLQLLESCDETTGTRRAIENERGKNSST